MPRLIHLQPDQSRCVQQVHPTATHLQSPMRSNIHYERIHLLNTAQGTLPDLLEQSARASGSRYRLEQPARAAEMSPPLYTNEKEWHPNEQTSGPVTDCQRSPSVPGVQPIAHFYDGVPIYSFTNYPLMPGPPHACFFHVKKPKVHTKQSPMLRFCFAANHYSQDKSGCQWKRRRCLGTWNCSQCDFVLLPTPKLKPRKNSPPRRPTEGCPRHPSYDLVYQDCQVVVKVTDKIIDGLWTVQCANNSARHTHAAPPPKLSTSPAPGVGFIRRPTTGNSPPVLSHAEASATIPRALSYAEASEDIPPLESLQRGKLANGGAHRPPIRVQSPALSDAEVSEDIPALESLQRGTLADAPATHGPPIRVQSPALSAESSAGIPPLESLRGVELTAAPATHGPPIRVQSPALSHVEGLQGDVEFLLKFGTENAGLLKHMSTSPDDAHVVMQDAGGERLAKTGLFNYVSNTLEGFVFSYPGCSSNPIVQITSTYDIRLGRWAPVVISLLMGKSEKHFAAHYYQLFRSTDYATGELFLTEFPGNIMGFTEEELNGYFMALRRYLAEKFHLHDMTREQLKHLSRPNNMHFLHSLVRLSRNKAIIEPDQRQAFYTTVKSLAEVELFDTFIHNYETILRTYPKVTSWLRWFLRDDVCGTYFKACRKSFEWTDEQWRSWRSLMWWRTTAQAQERFLGERFKNGQDKERITIGDAMCHTADFFRRYENDRRFSRNWDSWH